MTTKTTKKPVPVYKKYAKESSMMWIDPSSRLKPSDLSKPALDVVADDYPMIIEFNNIKDNTSQIHSIVDIDQPLFQPSPKIILFEDYTPFAIQEKKLFFRNNDSVARRIKVIQPDNPFFEISAPRQLNGEPLRLSKIAAGMEICYIIKFKPQEIRDYSLDLICSTEREKFIVPIRAMGMRPQMTFPDEVHFGNCPMKIPSRKSILVQNVGSSPALFIMRSNNIAFACPTEGMKIDPGASQMLEFFFSPTTAQLVTGEIEVEFNKGLKCYIQLLGSGCNVDVSLSTPSVALDHSYVSLFSRKSLKIKNMSNLPITFIWKSFAHEDEEEGERDRLLQEINRMESIELALLKKQINNGFYNSEDLADTAMDGHDSDDSDQGGSNVAFAARANEAALVRKYRNLRLALKNDSMQFVDDIFEVVPAEGQVWANSEIEITVTFKPDTAALFNCLGFLDISGRQDRLSLHMSGQGIGPHASLSFDILDVGDVFINDEQNYELIISNKGDIPAQWTFMSTLTRFGSKFDFSPKEGNLAPGKTQKIAIKFESDILGEFSEYFRFALQGNEDMLVCQIKGHVVGPTFHFDCTKIDFGVVSYDYLHSSTMRLVNTSKIPMVFNLHIPQDGTYLKKEFNIEPQEGTLLPGQFTDVLLEFIPTTVKLYDYSLAVDILGVGDILLSIPISAECIISTVRLEGKEVDFGECFIRYPYERLFKLTNVSDKVHTKFEFLPQPVYTRSTATYQVEPAIAVIEPNDSMTVKIRLIAQKLGSFKIPFQVAIAGSQEPPIQASMACSVIGPKVKVIQPELRWGNIECLKDSVQVLTVMNDSLITASMKLFLKMTRSKYDLSVRELVLDPQQSYDLQVTANLDDTVVSKDEIHIMVEESDNIIISLSSKGIGTTMHCQQELTVMDLGVQLTNAVFEKRIVLENKGRRPQQLRWSNRSVKEENERRFLLAKRSGKDPTQKLPKHLAPLEAVITVMPEEITLRPRTATTFTFKGSSANVGSVSEKFVLESRVGKERDMKQIVETEIKVEVVNPLLEFSVSSMTFDYTWERNVEPFIQKQDITLCNRSLIALTFVLKTEVPFNLSSWEHTLEPGQSVDLIVEFDPLYRDDKTSHIVDKSLGISYRGHAQKDSISLKASINFPNLKFDNTNIQFGSVLNDTSKVMKIKVTNCSSVVASYEWIFMEQKNVSKGRGSVMGIPLNQILDILPVRSVLQPNESEEVECTMFGSANNKFNGFVLCNVDGGPEYKFSVTGEASTVAYALDKSIIDFGKVALTEKQDSELTITNTGRVAFAYDVKLGRASDYLEIIPPSGKVQAGQSLKIIARIRPGLPIAICESFFIQIAHFDPLKITCYCQGIFPGAVALLPRQKKIGPFGEKDGPLKDIWQKFQEDVYANISTPDLSLLPPANPEDIPPPAVGNSANAPSYNIDKDWMMQLDKQIDMDNNNNDDDQKSLQSVTSSTRALPQPIVEMEMHRIVLFDVLSKKIDEIRSLPLIASEIFPLSPSSSSPKTFTSSAPESSTCIQALLAQHINIESIVVANYVCEFGNVICGQSRKKIFKVMNASLLGQLNWVFDKIHLSGSGFSIEPDRVSKLPEQGSVDFTVKYFARINQKLGRKTVNLPLEIKGSPSINIILTANVCLPEIEVSSDLVDFEKVLIGRSKKMFLRFQNNTPVTANWILRKIPGKEENKIIVEQMQGSLRAGKKAIINLEFIPSDARKYRLELQLKIDLNTKPKTLVIIGEGINTPLKFDPPYLDLGPVIPFFLGDEKLVTVTNNSDVPVELYSLDFDKKYLEEESILASLNIYDNDLIFRSSIRDAGNPLPPEIMDAYNDQVLLARLNSNIEDSALGSPRGPKYISPPLPIGPTSRDKNMHQDILIVGPPISGVSAIAAQVAKKMQLPVTTIDSMIEDVLHCEGEIGELSRRIFGRLSADEAAILADKEAGLLAASEKSKIEAGELFQKQNKKAKEIPLEVYDTPDAKAYAAFMESGKMKDAYLEDIFRFRFSWTDFGFGVIIDGVSSLLVDEELILNALKAVAPKLIIPILDIPDGSEGYIRHLEALMEYLIIEISRLTKSIEGSKKNLTKTKLSPRGNKASSSSAPPPPPPASTISKLPAVIPGTDILIAISNGDEPWVNQDTGLVMELDSSDFKALEEIQKKPFLNQLIYQQYLLIQAAQASIVKIKSIWDQESGLKVSREVTPSQQTIDIDNTEAVDDVDDIANGVQEMSVKELSSAANTTSSAKTLLYHEYIDKVADILPQLFSYPNSSTEENTAGASNSELLADEDNTDLQLASENQTQSNDSGLYNIPLDPGETLDVIISNVMALLPVPKFPISDKDALPPSSLFQVFRKPYGRSDRKVVKNFEIIRLSSSNKESETTNAGTCRWVIQPYDSIEFKVKFESVNEGKIEYNLGFEVMGTQQTYSLYCTGISEVPKINGDTRNIFMKRIRGIAPGSLPPLKRFVISDNYYSFGPILFFKKHDWRSISPESVNEDDIQNLKLIQTNVEVLRISNNGKYKCTVDFCFEDANEESKGIFSVDPKVLEIEEGETKDISIWAFPNAVKEYSNNLIACVSDNPQPLIFPLKCWGVEPTITITGPWETALLEAETAVAQCQDKKLIKDLEAKLAILKEALSIQFDRILINKTDTRQYEVQNTCLLPVAFEIDPGDFKDSANMTISPSSGIIPPGTALFIVLSFSSPEPLVVTGKFSMKYSDAEGGLQSSSRVGTKFFRATAEAYNIQAVSLTAQGQEEGGNEIDFGLMRVGDYAIQKLLMRNKGKYKIGFKLSFLKPTLANIIKIVPDEGTIETGNSTVEIQFTFCCSASEILLNGNKDIQIQIFEPLTNELVEKFPLSVSGQTKYNRFRMQPAKGMQFGAVRFDSDAKSKRIELRNEGSFAFTYIVCPAISENDEMDVLDSPALAAVAYATPAALRQSQLGENYLTRIGNVAPPVATGKKDSKPPAKGAKAAPPPPENTGVNNPLVQDPDKLPASIVPDNPLKIGAFDVSPRIGVVEPGQTVGIDMKFDPSGCENAREKLRFSITGTDPKDTTVQSIRLFDVSGESCFPAIVVNDFPNIFEEQEVVHSLSDIIESEANAAQLVGKFEKLSVGKVVYAEVEKMLAFGPVMCNPSGGKGVMERIRISNPTKIDAKVRFRVASTKANAAPVVETGKPTGKDAKAKDTGKGKGGAPKEEMAPPPMQFSVQPESWEIPPHEHRFVNIFFSPNEIKSYRAVFFAEVDYEGAETSAMPKNPNSGKVLTFDLAGSGTLPCITVEQPAERATDGSIKIDFGSVHIQRSNKKKIILRNDGVMPSTCLFQLQGDDDFVFPARGTSLEIAPGAKKEIDVSFHPIDVFGNGERNAQLKVTVLHNQYDQYVINLKAQAYACDAMIDTVIDEDKGTADPNCSQEGFKFPEVNLAAGGSGSSAHVVHLKSRSAFPLKYELNKLSPEFAKMFTFLPSMGHLAPNTTKEITISFATENPVKLEDIPFVFSLSRIEYQTNEDNDDAEDVKKLHGKWDNSMKVIRPATEEDKALQAQYDTALAEYNTKLEAEAKSKKKGKPIGPPPEPLNMEFAPVDENGMQMLYEIIAEPPFTTAKDAQEQTVKITASVTADTARFKCECADENINFIPTFLFQSTSHKFNFTNESDIVIPIKWVFESAKRRGTTRGALSSRGASRLGTQNNSSNSTPIPCPFFIEPEECEIQPKSTTQFSLKFLPIDTDDFVYLLRGLTGIPTINSAKTPVNADDEEDILGPIKMMIKGTAKRPLCHFDIVDSPDYLNRRQLNLKNENGLNSPIEISNIKVVEIESTGLRARNTFRFHVINPTNDNYEFIWEAIGDPNAAWRCVQSSGMLFGGKRVEMIFEYLPEEVSVAETFFKFKLPSNGVEQVFLFSGNVKEPKVNFSVSRIDFHAVMLGGEGGTEIIYLENHEDLPFNFGFDRSSLLQFEGINGSIIDIQPKAGVVPPHGRSQLTFAFHPQEEVVYNYNLVCDIKRKPNKLSINIKGEGYSCHPFLQLEQPIDQTTTGSIQNRYLTLRPTPFTNYADFGVVQVLDSVSKILTVTNNGKYNFDYIWDTESMDSTLALTGGKLGGTLHKGEESSYKLTFAPQKESVLNGSMLSFTVAGKYTYNIVARGNAVEPALRFSFMQYDFGPCFVTSPGGSTVIEEVLLRLVNHDPINNISIECSFQKTRALWVECQPVVLEPGGMIDVPIKFAPRDVKDYTFIIPFVINGTSKVSIHIEGRGILPRLELVNQSQHRVNFGVVNVGGDVRKSIALVNRSKKALPIQLIEEGQYGAGILDDRCVTFSPTNEFIIEPKDTLNVQVSFVPNKRIGQFSEDLMIRYAGITRKLLNLSGKAQGYEVNLETDSLPFGVVVMDSQKIKKLSLENTGDLSIGFQWMEGTFGKHFKITPLTGKLLPGGEITFDVVFKPQFTDEDIRQEGITLIIPGLPPLNVTCTGSCVQQKSDSIQTIEFNSLARKAEGKAVKITNTGDKDWYLSPSLQGIHWKIPHEFKVPAKGSADMAITYFPLTMCPKSTSAPDEAGNFHAGKVFVALPDGSALSYNLKGNAGAPECSGQVSIEAPAKKPSTVNVKLINWLGETQKFNVGVELLEKSSPATTIIAANVVEVAPNGTKEFPLRFLSYTEGNTKGRITFTNPSTGEYCYYDINGKTTMSEILETISMDSPVRQTARYIISIENPLPPSIPITMGNVSKPGEWWSCDSKYIKVNELTQLTGNHEGSFEVEYRPLVATQQPQELLLTLYTKELGMFKYKLIVKSGPPTLQQSLRFDVPLGSNQSESFIFRAYNTVKTDYICSVKKQDFFSVPKTVPVDAIAKWEGEDIRVNISFEPTAIGEIRDMLTLSSAEGGEYTCELIGVCVPALPQGPFNLVQGGGVLDIPFRNCFPQSCTWSFTVDSSAFKIVTANAIATVAAKTEGKVSLSFEPHGELLQTPGGFITAKLFVACTSIADIAPWVFYLRGKIDLNAPVVAAVAAKGGKK